MASEKTPLLRRQANNKGSDGVSRPLYDSTEDSKKDGDTPQESKDSKDSEIRLKRHINLPYAISIMIGNVIGSGIFLSPKGVTENIGSVGGSLIIWATTGLYNLAQALCYAELGTVIPKAGGDYAYLHKVLGPLPAFMTAWVHVVVIASSSCAVISRTAATYLFQPLDLGCRLDLITLTAVFIIVTLATINGLSTVWGTRVQAIFFVAKVAALIIVIIAGMVKLGQGYTSSFQKPFEGTNSDPGLIALAVLDGYFAYKGWELIMALPEEMVSPTRDLGPCVWISMLSVTSIYVLTNVAYFSVLSPAQLLKSDAVALTFAEKALGPVAVIMPIAVCLSCMGAVNGDFLSNSRYVFAGGRFRQVPKVFSFIHAKLFTPLLAVALLCLLAVIYCVITDLQLLQEYASLTVQLKMILALVALFYLRWKSPDLHRAVKVNIVVAIVTMILMIGIVGLSFYKSPVTTGIGVGMFALGLPFYGLILLVRDRKATNAAMDKITVVLQQALYIVPETKNIEDRIKGLD